MTTRGRILKGYTVHLRILAAACISLGIFLIVGAARSDAAGTNGGAATITMQDAVTPLTSGGSSTIWTIALPPQAHCSGDSASHGFHVFSYIVPSTIDPSTLSFTSSGASAGNPLYDQGASPYIAANTAPVSGQVIEIPNDFNWALFSPDGSAGISNPNGTYNVGIACATGTGAEDVYWNAVVTFTASSTDPNMQVWTTSAASTTTTSSTVAATTTSSTAGGPTTTSTTVAGGTTTTSTTVVGGGTTTTTASGSSTTTSTTVVGTTATTSGVGALAATGAPMDGEFNWGIGLVLGGLAAVLFSRRRMRSSSL